MNDFIEKQTSQKTPAGGAVSTESLNAMSSVELADALETLLDSMTDENYDSDLIDVYLDALDQKTPMPEQPNVEKALEEFKDTFSFGDGGSAQERVSAHAVRRRPFKRVLLTVAATVALVFALMIGAQAAGLDVFGNLARWTDELFFFIPSSNGSTYASEYYDAFQQALETQELPKELAPTWFPDGFAAGEPEFWDDDVSKAVQLTFINSEGKNFSVSVDYYKNEESLWELPFEKDASDVEVYTSNNRTFYIMSNIDTITAAWSDGNLVETIWGELSVEEVEKMIDSMGG